MTIQKDIAILEIVLIKINKYLNHSLCVSSLISSLENLLNQLTTIDMSWKKDFWVLWLDIEIVYSLALDQGLESLSKEGNTITENSLHDLKKMTEEKLNELKSNFRET
jgi:hypothetical protein